MNIAADLSKTLKYTISADQCDSKWKGLKKTYKKIKDLNNTTGNKPKKWEFYYVMDNLLGNKPEVIPQAVCSSSEGLIINKVPERASTTKEIPINKGKRKASGVEFRHNEKMQKYDEFLHLFKLTVEHTIGRKVDEN
ncbi:unnamed protein product [Psylliodes chrysocephalus]|uniref:Myb/SANT-like DNA-binding domain-containing protein n=1 Tax=Psylliodes chrysocephalus TaxID=3402493 RepID=A0A9P0CWI5_9CUCU|nr:unnamed protein product [Psylliodes chrysocephala]